MAEDQNSEIARIILEHSTKSTAEIMAELNTKSTAEIVTELRTKTNAQILGEHYQKTYEVTYQLWKQRNIIFLVLVGVIALATLLTFQAPNTESLFAGWIIFKILGLSEETYDLNSFPFGLLQSIFLIVIFYLMVNLYHRSLYVLRTYRYLGKLEDEIRHLLKLEEDLDREEDAIISFTREGRFYQAERPPLQLQVKWFYIALVGGLLLAFFGGRIYYDFDSGNTLLAVVDLLVACATLAVFCSYAASSVTLDAPKPQGTASNQELSRTQEDIAKTIWATGFILITFGFFALIGSLLEFKLLSLLYLSAASLAFLVGGFLYGNRYLLIPGLLIPGGLLFGGAGVLLARTFYSLGDYEKGVIFMGCFAFGWVIITALTKEFFTRNTLPWSLVPGGISAIIWIGLLLGSLTSIPQSGGFGLGILLILLGGMTFLFQTGIQQKIDNWSPAAELSWLPTWWWLTIVVAVLMVIVSALVLTLWVLFGLFAVVVVAVAPILKFLQIDKVKAAKTYLRELQDGKYERAYNHLCPSLKKQNDFESYKAKAQAWTQAWKTKGGIKNLDRPWIALSSDVNIVKAKIAYGNTSKETCRLKMHDEQGTWKVCEPPPTTAE